MKYIIAGLGNPGSEYEGTRHNAGRMALEALRIKLDAPAWKPAKKGKALVTEAKVGKHTAVLVLPESFMNNSGREIAQFVKTQKEAQRLIVAYDDLDLPIGAMKLAFDRGDGGHKGIASTARTIKTRAFVRVRIGISPKTAKGVAKKPKGEKAVIDFILKKFTPKEKDILKKVNKRAAEAILAIIEEGRESAMNEYNQ